MIKIVKVEEMDKMAGETRKYRVEMGMKLLKNTERLWLEIEEYGRNIY